MSKLWVKAVFFTSGAYDFGLGAAFLLFAPFIYRLFHVAQPGHPFYYQFPSLEMMIVGVLFCQIGKSPRENVDLMLYGAALKSSFVGLVLWYALHAQMPSFWIPFGWLDAVFLALFLAAWYTTRQDVAPPAAQILSSDGADIK